MLGKKNADTKMSTLIGAGAELTGDFTLDGSARIDGKIGGNVTVTGNLILGRPKRSGQDARVPRQPSQKL